MNALRALGTLVAVAAGGAAGVGAGLQVGGPYVVGAAAAGAALVVGYAVGNRGWLPMTAALSYLGVGVAAFRGPFDPAPLARPAVAAFLGVGALVTLLFALRWQAGNLKRLSTRPVDAGAVRNGLATVAATLRDGRSLVRRVAGVRAGPVPVGAVTLAALWVGVVAGSVLLGRALDAGTVGAGLDPGLSAALAPVTLVPYLAALLVPVYLATDWYGLSGVTAPAETDGVVARARGYRPPAARSRRSRSQAATGAAAAAGGAGATTAGGDATSEEDHPEADDAAATTEGTDGETTTASDEDATPAETETTPDDGGGTTRRERHWPNAEDNPWTGGEETASGSAAAADADASTGADAATPELGDDDERASRLGVSDAESESDASADDDRVVFGEPTGESHDSAAEAAQDAPTPAPGRVESNAGDDATADREPADGDGDEDETAGEDDGGDVAWTTPPSVDEDATSSSAATSDPDGGEEDATDPASSNDASEPSRTDPAPDDESDATEDEAAFDEAGETNDGVDDDDGGRASQVADRVARILDGDLDAGEADDADGDGPEADDPDEDESGT